MAGSRGVRRVLTAPFQRHHYRALMRLPVVCERPFDTLRRYLTSSGDYPHDVRVRTPVGVETVRTHAPADVRTVNEIFCREDYRCGTEIATVLDIGANIGVSGLYFLTRNEHARVWLYEPNPPNVTRLKENLAPYAGRIELHEAAVGVADGPVTFHVEPTGRYGGIEADTGETITVACRAIDAVVEEILATREWIDVLKIDTEGYEFKTLNRLRPELARRIRLVYLETPRERELFGDLFASSYRGGIQRLVRRG
jgi:FkbM family methyltransferase